MSDNRWFIFWRDYNGESVDEFSDKEDAENKLTEVLQKEEQEENGSCVISVVYGRAFKFSVKQRVSKAVIEEE